MLPLYEHPHFTFFFAEDRIISRFHLGGVEPGQQVVVIRIDPTTNARLALLTTSSVGTGGWVDLQEPIIIRAGEAFIVERIPSPSLCERCQWMREINTPKGSRFLLCQLSLQNSDYTKYPPQPVVACLGFIQLQG